jgi:hypothetical protein
MEDYFVKNTVSLEISADTYEIKIDFKDQQRRLHQYKIQKKYQKICSAFFFNLVFFNNVINDDEIMTLRIELCGDDKILILWIDDHRMRIKSMLFNGKERLDWIINEVVNRINAEIE